MAPANPFAALWLRHALAAAENHYHQIRREAMLAVAPWVAANIDYQERVSERMADIGAAVGIHTSKARGGMRALKNLGFLTCEPRTNEIGKSLPSVYALALPASVVDAELVAMTEGAEQTLAALEVHA